MAIIERPRNIPVVDVKLDEEFSVHVHPTFAAPALISEIFHQNLVSRNNSEYGGGSNSEFAFNDETDSKQQVARFLIKNDTPNSNHVGLTLVGDYMVLSPTTVPKYQTLIKTSGSASGGPDVNNTWGGQAGDNADSFQHVPLDGVSCIVKKDISKDGDTVWHQISSNFELHKNQPISLRFSFLQDPPSCKNTASSWFSSNLGAWQSSVVGNSRRGTSCILFTIGEQYVIAVFSDPFFDAQIFKITTSTDDTARTFTYVDTLPVSSDNNGFGVISLYPIEDTLYIYDGIPENPVEDTYIQITEKELVNYKGRIVAMSFGGSHIFSFSPLVHVLKAYFESPNYELPFSTVADHVDILCAGKKPRQTSAGAANIVTWNTSDDKYPEYVGAKITGALYTKQSSDEKTRRYYRITLEPRTLDSNQKDITSYYSPAISRIEYWAESPDEAVNLNPNPQISNSDVREITISETVEGSNAQILLNNRVSAPEKHRSIGGRYSYPQGDSNFCGVKPITVKVGYKGEVTETNKIQRFSGFVVDRQYSRTGSAEANVILMCVDRSKHLRESYAFNLPIYDGWCHLAVIYDLAREAGMSDEQILFYQNPVTGGDIITLRSLIEGSGSRISKKSGGCYDGHVDGWPPGLAGKYLNYTIPGSYLHAKVSTAAVAIGVAPQWMFEMGTPLWDCMLRVRTYTHFLLFVNNYGNLIYCPPHYYYHVSPQLTFRDMPTGPGDFNEVQSQATVTQSTAQMRNCVVVGGLYTTGKNPNAPIFVPTYLTRIAEKWYEEIDTPSFAPWLRVVFDRDPMIADPNRLAFKADELYKRVTRDTRTISFATWGNPEVYPYQIINFIERTGESGVPEGTTAEGGATYIVSAVNHQLGENKEYITTIDAELFDPTKYTFGPMEAKVNG